MSSNFGLENAMIVPSAPISAFIQLTADCNNACPGCSNKFQDSINSRKSLPNPLSANEWRRVFIELKPYVTRLRITGGEATLHPEFETILSYLSELKTPFSLFTNARWKNPDHLIEVLSTNSEYRGMLVSLHGSTEEEHEAFSNIPGSFYDTVSNIKHVVRKGLRVHTNTVITKKNFQTIGKMMMFASEIGVSMVVIARLIGDAPPELQVTANELRHAITHIEYLRGQRERIKHSGCIPQCFSYSGAYGCTAALTFCTIDPWGNVFPCNHISHYCGNILKQSIIEIWKSPPMNSWRNNISNDCINCEAFGICHGGCHAAGNLIGQVNDPLMTHPIKSSGKFKPISRNITYKRTKKPELCCSIRSEPFGFLLVKEMYSLPVSADAEIILNACNGNFTLQDILERFGQQGLNFVGALAKKGYVKLR